MIVGCTGSDDVTAQDVENAREAVDETVVDSLLFGDIDFDDDPSSLTVGVKGLGRDAGRVVYEQTQSDDPIYPSPEGFMEQLSQANDVGDRYGERSVRVLADAENFFGGYQDDERFDALSDREKRNTSARLLAVGLVVAVGGPIGEEIAAMIDESAGPLDLFDHIQSNRSVQSVQYLEVFTGDLVDGVEDGAQLAGQ